jgi:predicted alpha/beta-hydrolase family hydrolase
MIELLIEGPETGPVLVLAHGAGAGMASPFMTLIAELLAARGIATVRFEFAYMAARRETAKRRPPPKAEKLTTEYEAAIDLVRRRHPGRPLLIGGKSMGGRVASYVADAAFDRGNVAGLVCLGYPFHPPGKPEQLRTAHLETLRCPALFAQGERDPFGTRKEVEAMTLAPGIAFHWAGDGDHDLGPRGGKGFTRKGNLAAAADAVAAFAEKIASAGQ